MLLPGCRFFRLKCTKFDFGWGSTPDPHRSLQRSPIHLTGFKRSYFSGEKRELGQGKEGKKREGRKGKGKEMVKRRWEGEGNGRRWMKPPSNPCDVGDSN